MEQPKQLLAPGCGRHGRLAAACAATALSEEELPTSQPPGGAHPARLRGDISGDISGHPWSTKDKMLGAVASCHLGCQRPL